MEWPHISCTEYPMQLTMPLSTLRMVPSVRAQALAMPSEGSVCANAWVGGGEASLKLYARRDGREQGILC